MIYAAATRLFIAAIIAAIFVDVFRFFTCCCYALLYYHRMFTLVIVAYERHAIYYAMLHAALRRCR